MNGKPTVYIVDDDLSIRRSTSMLLESVDLPYKAFESAMAFLDEVRPDMPGCLILDLHMPGMNGLDLVVKMRTQDFILPVVVVSGTGTVPLAVEGMKLGLLDFLVKPADPDVLLAKIRAALELDSKQRPHIESSRGIRAKFATLTPREHELLDLIVAGMPNKNIATTMGISIKTVENHRANLMVKTGALNTADLVRMKMSVAEQ